MRYNGSGITLKEYKKIMKWNRLLLPLPSNDSELEVLSRYIFGVKLHLLKLNLYGDCASYEVKEDHDYYYDQKFNRDAQCSSYEVDTLFWASVIGSLTCGGIARASYGQVKVFGYRNKKRIFKWVSSRGRKDANYIRPAFVRLAERCGSRRKQK